MIFFPGIQIEVAPFLQAVRVETQHVEHVEQMESVLSKYDAGFVFEMEAGDRNPDNAEKLGLPVVTVSDEQQSKQRVNTKNKNKSKNGSKSKKGGKKSAVQKSRSPSLRRDERIKLNLYTDVSPIWKKNEEHEQPPKGASSHCIDFDVEMFLGPVYHVVVLNTGKKPKQCGAWTMRTETNLEPHSLNGEILQIALKVPVEEVFIGPGEPVMAFCEDDSEEWKKGVYTTHTQFDQTTFVVKARLSKLGKVALFQQIDFHFPYRRWNIKFEKNTIIFHLHTNSVEIKFIIDGAVIYLETQAGDEFSKLRSLHQRRFTLSAMGIHLKRHGVHIFPNSESLKKQRDSRKGISLEKECYRTICIDQLECQSCRLNGSVASDTAIISCAGTTMQFCKTSDGTIEKSRSGEPPPSNEEKCENKLGIGTLFQWLILTRPLSMTKC